VAVDRRERNDPAAPAVANDAMRRHTLGGQIELEVFEDQYVLWLNV
jgi:hypothetical protein